MTVIKPIVIYVCLFKMLTFVVHEPTHHELPGFRLLGFNSKLVRLEVKRILQHARYDRFQFQTGAIRRI